MLKILGPIVCHHCSHDGRGGEGGGYSHSDVGLMDEKKIGKNISDIVRGLIVLCVTASNEPNLTFVAQYSLKITYFFYLFIFKLTYTTYNVDQLKNK